MPASSLPCRPPGLAPPASPGMESSPTNQLLDSAASAPCLSPAHCRRAPTRPVSCYALFECMAASKPTSWLSGRAHILCHLARPLGPWRAVWAVSLSSAQLSPRALTPGVRPSAFGVWSGSVGGEAPSPVQCSTSDGQCPGPALKLFRGERDISGFDRPFTPIHGSSPPFSTEVGSGLHGVLPPLHPAHG